MKIASANSWSAKGASRSSASFHSFHKCLPCLPSRWVSLSVLCPIMLLWFCWRSDWPRVKNLWLYNLKLEQAMRNLACGDLNCSYWGGLKLRKLVINDWVHVFPRVASGMAGGWWVAVEMTCTCLRDFWWGVQMRKIGGTIKKRISL